MPLQFGPRLKARLIVRIEPERVTGFENGQPWDVTGQAR
jgi:hypothetical protein